MLESIKDSPLYKIVNPESIAILGASNKFANMGTMILASMQGLGFEGSIYPVHPKEDQVSGLEAYRSVLDLPEVPDLAVMILPTPVVAQALDECGRKGVKQAVVVSGGFKEVGGQGPCLEKELVKTAHKHGIRFIGPNCLGASNPHHKLNTTPFPYVAEPGFIGMASHSGSFVTQMYNLLSQIGLGFSTAFSCGNEADVDMVDCLEYLGACPNTRVIALYIEGVKRGREFIRAAREIAPHKPIAAYYVGGSETGRRAGLSHTGAMAGPDGLYSGMFRQAGIIRAETIEELFDFCWVLGALPRPKGNKVALLSDSGGPGAAGADACGRAGLDLPAFTPETMEKLRPLIPHTGSINNPVDLTFHRNHMDFYTKIPEILLEGKNIDSMMTYFLMPVEFTNRALEAKGVPEDQVGGLAAKQINKQIEPMARLLETKGKPIVGYTWRSLTEQSMQALMAGGIPIFKDPKRAARALAAMVEYNKLRERIVGGG